jgi:hypothetical protein
VFPWQQKQCLVTIVTKLTGNEKSRFPIAANSVATANVKVSECQLMRVYLYFSRIEIFFSFTLFHG